ncbi:MAG: dihydrolipoamide acetyltransferase family protein [Bacteroidota bacterium]
MASVLRLPRMSDTMEEGVIASMKIKVGDTLKPGMVIAEVETDKATMEWESFVSGTVLHITAKDGDTIPVEGMVAILGKPGEDFQALLSGDTAKPAAAATTSKVENTSSNTNPPQVMVAPSMPVATAPTSDGRVKASPLAKTIAKENGIDISSIAGSGEEGRIIKKDIEAALSNKSASISSAPSIAGQESFTEVAVSQMRKTIAKRLAESKFGAPHFYLTMEICMDEAMHARESMNQTSPAKLSFNDLVIKATAMSLRQNPVINSSWLGDKIRYNNHIHIGMAVAVEEGLLVPVIKFADQLSLSQIAASAKDFAEKAKGKKLQPNDMQGNTFTISNLGMMGIEEFTAIINPPDACILAVGGIKKVLALKDGDIIESNMMKVTLSCDHRVVDGMKGAQFLQTLKSLLENPVRMLI